MVSSAVPAEAKQEKQGDKKDICSKGQLFVPSEG